MARTALMAMAAVLAPLALASAGPAAAGEAFAGLYAHDVDVSAGVIFPLSVISRKTPRSCLLMTTP